MGRQLWRHHDARLCPALQLRDGNDEQRRLRSNNRSASDQWRCSRTKRGTRTGHLRLLAFRRKELPYPRVFPTADARGIVQRSQPRELRWLQRNLRQRTGARERLRTAVDRDHEPTSGEVVAILGQVVVLKG